MKLLVLWFTLLVFGIFGWGRCAYKFMSCDFKPSYKAEIIYGCGLVFGYGAVVGYFEFEDGIEETIEQNK